MLKFIQSFLVVCLVVLMAGGAWGDFYVIGGGKRYKRTIVVSPVPGDASASGASLLKAVNGITGSTKANEYLVKLEPGYYDIGSNTLNVPGYVDIEGSGKNITTIEGSSDQGIISLSVFNEFRHLKVYSDQQKNLIGIKVSNDIIYRICNVIIHLKGGTCSGDFQAIGIKNEGIGLEIEDVDIIIDDYPNIYCIYNLGTVTIEGLNIPVNKACKKSVGIYNESMASIRSSKIDSKASTTVNPGHTYGIHNSGGELMVQDSDIYSSVNDSYVYGIFNEKGGTVKARNTLIWAFDGTGGSWGLLNSGASGDEGGDCWLDNSQINAETYALRNDSSNTIYAGSCLMNTDPTGSNIKLVHCYTHDYVAKPDQ